MATRTAVLTLIACVALSRPIAAGDYPQSGTIQFEVKSTASEQFSYATRIMSGVIPAHDRVERTLTAVIALEQIPARWPAEREIAFHAFEEIVRLLMSSQMSTNALQYCSKARAYLGNDPRRVVFDSLEAHVQLTLGRQRQAQEAIAAVMQSNDVSRLSAYDRRGVLRSAAWISERSGDARSAAQFMRRAAVENDHALLRARDWQHALELQLPAHDETQERRDLANLIEAAAQARRIALSPSEIEVLRRVDDAIASHRKRLHV